ncbi:hypothetical protein DENSPDRAFT_873144 [Dentipellis sp. KUC8613]|nr:hypothetical protein DENSPDRAFT_873144 [Dentipellis sp. KUC8613]
MQADQNIDWLGLSTLEDDVSGAVAVAIRPLMRRLKEQTKRAEYWMQAALTAEDTIKTLRKQLHDAEHPVAANPATPPPVPTVTATVDAAPVAATAPTAVAIVAPTPSFSALTATPQPRPSTPKRTTPYPPTAPSSPAPVPIPGDRRLKREDANSSSMWFHTTSLDLRPLLFPDLVVPGRPTSAASAASSTTIGQTSATQESHTVIDLTSPRTSPQPESTSVVAIEDVKAAGSPQPSPTTVVKRDDTSAASTSESAPSKKRDREEDEESVLEESDESHKRRKVSEDEDRDAERAVGTPRRSARSPAIGRSETSSSSSSRATRRGKH